MLWVVILAQTNVLPHPSIIWLLSALCFCRTTDVRIGATCSNASRPYTRLAHAIYIGLALAGVTQRLLLVSCQTVKDFQRAFTFPEPFGRSPLDLEYYYRPSGIILSRPIYVVYIGYILYSCGGKGIHGIYILKQSCQYRIKAAAIYPQKPSKIRG
jgi:hypothetical protein